MPITVKISNQSPHALPEYATSGASGMDVRANLETPITLKSLERQLVPTGLFIEIPAGFEVQVRPRSGLAIKHGITCLNSPGTIDSDYRGEIKIILVNLSAEPFTINPGDRIAQLVLQQVEKMEWKLTEHIQETGRNQGGFGHTGIH
jgi:dUTP pyrophosphatase